MNPEAFDHIDHATRRTVAVTLHHTPTTVDPAELLASSDVAALLGVERSVLSNWKRRHRDFPAPVATVAGGTVTLYLRRDILAYRDRRQA